MTPQRYAQQHGWLVEHDWLAEVARDGFGAAEASALHDAGIPHGEMLEFVRRYLGLCPECGGTLRPSEQNNTQICDGCLSEHGSDDE